MKRLFGVKKTVEAASLSTTSQEVYLIFDYYLFVYILLLLRNSMN